VVEHDDNLVDLVGQVPPADVLGDFGSFGVRGVGRPVAYFDKGLDAAILEVAACFLAACDDADLDSLGFLSRISFSAARNALLLKPPAKPRSDDTTTMTLCFTSS
jgi:hypothetical protein